MSPPKITVSREQVNRAALKVLRKAGLAGLSARAVADVLGTSVGPIYRAYRNMNALTAAALDGAMAVCRDYTSRPYTDMPFRSVGVGLVLFARDEPRLYQALFVERHRFGEVLAAFQKEVLMAVDQDEHLGMLPDDLRTELMVDMWVYTHGLATLVISGTFPKPTVEAVDQKLSRVGGIVITAAMAAALPPVSGWRPVVANENKRTPKAPERRKG